MIETRFAATSRSFARGAAPTAISPAVQRDNDRAMMPHGEQVCASCFVS